VPLKMNVEYVGLGLKIYSYKLYLVVFLFYIQVWLVVSSLVSQYRYITFAKNWPRTFFFACLVLLMDLPCIPLRTI